MRCRAETIYLHLLADSVYKTLFNFSFSLVWWIQVKIEDDFKVRNGANPLGNKVPMKASLLLVTLLTHIMYLKLIGIESKRVACCLKYCRVFLKTERSHICQELDTCVVV